MIKFEKLISALLIAMIIVLIGFAFGTQLTVYAANDSSDGDSLFSYSYEKQVKTDEGSEHTKVDIHLPFSIVGSIFGVVGSLVGVLSKGKIKRNRSKTKSIPS